MAKVAWTPVHADFDCSKGRFRFPGVKQTEQSRAASGGGRTEQPTQSSQAGKPRGRPEDPRSMGDRLLAIGLLLTVGFASVNCRKGPQRREIEHQMRLVFVSQKSNRAKAGVSPEDLLYRLVNNRKS